MNNGAHPRPGRATKVKEEIIARALHEGFDVVRVTDAKAAAGNREGLLAYLEDQGHQVVGTDEAASRWR